MASQEKALDMSLDDIIKQKRARGGGRGRGRGGQRGGGSGRGRPGGRQGAGSPGRGRGGRFGRGRPGGVGGRSGSASSPGRSPATSPRARGSGTQSARLVISNLHYDVTDADIKELFGEFGPVRKVQVHFDKSGKSLGTADVFFARSQDAIRAMRQYDGVPLDGRAMKIQMLSQQGRQLVSSPSPRKPSGGGRVGSPGRRQQGRGRGNRQSPGRGGGRGNSRGRGRGRPKPVSKEQLDAELDAYQSQGGATSS